ncbi:MAG: glycosyltransferase, partial [Chromatiaceae bacterium]|nr:glycosyltransferase [Chromatiaceae bacterium]
MTTASARPVCARSPTARRPAPPEHRLPSGHAVVIHADDRSKRLAVFASFSGQGGVERMLVHLIQGFCAQGYQVDLLLVRTQSAHLDDLPEGVRCIPLGPRHTWLASFALARWLRRERPPVLLAVKDRAGLAAVIARALAATDTRLVLRLGTNLSAALSGSNPLKRWLRLLPIRRLYPAIEQIVAVSEGV